MSYVSGFESGGCQSYVVLFVLGGGDLGFIDVVHFPGSGQSSFFRQLHVSVSSKGQQSGNKDSTEEEETYNNLVQPTMQQQHQHKHRPKIPDPDPDRQHFPKGHELHKICNRNTLKMSYSCMDNMGTTVDKSTQQ